MSRLRFAAILGSSCLSEPAAALRGFAKSGCSLASKISFILLKLSLDKNTSPLTSRKGISSFKVRGMLLIVFRFSVTSSPLIPSPRVEPLVNSPSTYSSRQFSAQQRNLHHAQRLLHVCQSQVFLLLKMPFADLT